MWRSKHKKSKYLLMLGFMLTFGWNAPATALQSSSLDYGVDETFFGSGGMVCDPGNNGSLHYCASASVGDLAAGNTKSLSYQAQAGNLDTDRAPYIEMVVGTPSTDIGTLTTSSTHVATATFSVKTYLAGGYIVINSSPGPVNNGYTMHNMSSATTSSIGTEQFGINLKANTCPASAPASGSGSCTSTLGSNITQNPDSTFGFGQVQTGYDSANNYKYNNGDTVAYSNSSSGETDYTVSYIFNISNITPGGTYIFKHNLVATSTY